MPRCYRCMRPQAMCLCDSVPSIPTKTVIHILQHPHERTHPFGTAKLIRLGLPSATIHTIIGGERRDLHCPLSVPEDAVLLYPHPEAEDLTDLARREPPSTLVVLDGTWAHSRQLYRHNPWLENLRHVRITPNAPSRYRIRREPRPDCLSTLEAIVIALRAIERDPPDLSPLLAAFDRMIDSQIAHLANRPRRVRTKRPRQRASRRTSPLLHDPRLVVLYVESSRPGGDEAGRRELVQVVAARCGGSDTFEAVLRPVDRPATDRHLAHMGLSRDDLDGGCPLDEASARLRAFVGDDPVASWTPGSLNLASPLLGEHSGRFVLKTNYCNLLQRNPGKLDSAIRHHGLTPHPVTCRGRARDRLGSALAIAEWMRKRDEGGRPCN